MNVDLIPAVVAAGGGSALMAAILAYEHRRVALMRASRERLAVRFGRSLDVARALAAVEKLAGLREGCEIVAEVAAVEGRIEHALWVPAAEIGTVEALLAGALGTVRMDAAAPMSGEGAYAMRLSLPMPLMLQAGDPASASQTLLAGLVRLRADEQVLLRWALQPGRPRQLKEPASSAVERAWQHKTERPGMFAAGQVLVSAASSGRARELAGQVESVIRGLRGGAGIVQVARRRGRQRLSVLPRVRRSSGWLSADEILTLLGWPLGAMVPGVEPCAPLLAVPGDVPRTGRRLFIGRDWRGERSVALDALAARHHMLAIGPSGSGKSELLAAGILDQIAAGYGGVVIDPKADLIASVLDRVEAKNADRVVVLDAGDRERPIPGLALLRGGDADLRADVLLGVLRSIFADVWSVRSDWYGRLAIRTLAAVPGATLADLGRPFADPAYRRMALGHLDDEFLRSAWQGFEALSPAAQAEHVQAPVNRVMELLARPRLRAALASPDPKLDVGRLLSERKWLLVSLAPGQIGEAGARLLGAAVMYLVWSAIEARVALPPQQRHPLFVYVDELATLASLPFSFELLAERARGLGAGLSIGVQNLARISEPLRGALLANTATILSFRAPAEEATRIARLLPPLTADDVQSLGRFEVAARVATGAGSAGVVLTGRTEPLPPPTGHAGRIRERSASRYAPTIAAPGRPVEAVSDEGQIGVRRAS